MIELWCGVCGRGSHVWVAENCLHELFRYHHRVWWIVSHAVPLHWNPVWPGKSTGFNGRPSLMIKGHRTLSSPSAAVLTLLLGQPQTQPAAWANWPEHSELYQQTFAPWRSQHSNRTFVKYTCGWVGRWGKGGWGWGRGRGTLTRTAPGGTPWRPSSVRPCAGDIAETWWDTRWHYTSLTDGRPQHIASRVAPPACTQPQGGGTDCCGHNQRPIRWGGAAPRC